MMRTKDRFWVILSWLPADLHSQSAPIPDYEQHFKSSSSLLYGAVQCLIECVTHPWPLPVDANITLCHTSHYNKKCLPAYSVASGSLQHHGLQPARLLCPWGFPRQEYWSGLPCPPSGDLPNPGIKPGSPTLQADSLPPETPRKSQNTAQPIPSPGDHSDPGIKLGSPALVRQIPYQLSYREVHSLFLLLHISKSLAH